MAGQGTAPKEPEHRARANVPIRGEWQSLPKVGVGPPAPNADWSVRTQAAWSAWWNDPASTQWSQADVEAVHALAELMDAGLLKHAAEIRLRTDALGLSQKGKRDLRWRIEEPVEAAPAKKPRTSGLRLVDESSDAVSA